MEAQPEPPEAPMIRKRLHEIEDEKLSKIPKLGDNPRRLQRDYVDGVWKDAKQTLSDARQELNQIGIEVNKAEMRLYPCQPGGGPPGHSLYGYFRCFITRLNVVDNVALAWYEKQRARLDKIDEEFGKLEKSPREAAYSLLETLPDLKYAADRIPLSPHEALSPEFFIEDLYDKITPLQEKSHKAEKKLEKYWKHWQNNLAEKMIWKLFEEAQNSVQSKVTFAEKYRENINREAPDKERYRKKGEQRESSVGGEPRYPSGPRNTQSLVSSRGSTPASVGDLPLTRKPSPVESPPPLMRVRERSATRSSSDSRQSSSSNSRQPSSTNSRKKSPSNSRQPSSSNSRKKSPSNSRKQSLERKKNG